MIPVLTAFASSGILLLFIVLLGILGHRNPIIGKRIRILLLALLIQLVSDTVAYFDLPLPELASQGLIALLVLLLAVFLISMLKEFSLTWLSVKGVKVSKLITDVSVALIYIILILVLLKELFGINVTPLLATSAVLTMVLGLALQDTLANLIAGTVFHFENSIRIGDWLEYDGVIGEVRELSWRAVRLVTTRRDDILIPNTELTKQKFSNLTKLGAAREKDIGTSYRDDPDLVMRVLRKAVLSTPGVRWDPEPQIWITGFDDFSINYRLRFYIKQYLGFQKLEGEVMRNVWYLFKTHGITIPFPIRTLQIERRDKPVLAAHGPEEVCRALGGIEVFSSFNEAEIAAIAEYSELLDYPKGTVLAEEGESGERMFAILSGRVEVLKHGKRVTTLAAGDIFGEISLFSGGQRTASVRALTDLEVLEIPEDGFETILKKNKEFIAKIESIVEERLESYPEFSDLEKTAKPKVSLINQIRGYLLGGGHRA
jgi:small-conductance mechanosensitive channel